MAKTKGSKALAPGKSKPIAKAPPTAVPTPSAKKVSSDQMLAQLLALAKQKPSSVPIPVKVVEKKPGMSFGPKPLISTLTRPADLSIAYVCSAFDIGPLINGVAGMVAYLLSECSSNLAVNAAYAYRYFIDTVFNNWLGKVPGYTLAAAPPVYWDLFDAGTPRRYKDFSLSITGTDANGATIKDPTSQFTQNTPFGSLAFDNASSKFDLITTSLSSYTEALGHAAAEQLLSDVGRRVKLVSRSAYKTRIAADDPSLFACVNTDQVYDTALGSVTANGVGITVARIVHAPDYGAKWLHHFAGGTEESTSFFITTHPFKFLPARQLVSTPASILVDRMMKGLAGNEQSDRITILKAFDLKTVTYVFDRLILTIFNRTAKAGYGLDQATVFPDLNPTDVQYMIQLIIKRQFASWLAVSAGLTTNLNLAHGVNIGSGGFPYRGSSTLYFPKVILDSINCLLPFEEVVSGVKRAVYPVLVSTGDTLSALGLTTANYAAAASGSFQSTWSWFTNLNGGGGEVAASFDPDMNPALCKKWNTSMGWLQPVLTISTGSEDCDINFAHCTAINFSDGTLLGVCSSQEMTDYVGERLDRAILPFYNAPVGSATKAQAYAFRNCLQTLWNEKHFNSGAGLGATQRDAVLNAMIMAIHPLSGNGADVGIVEHSDNAPKKEKEEGGLVDNVKKGALNTASKALEKFLIDQAVQFARRQIVN